MGDVFAPEFYTEKYHHVYPERLPDHHDQIEVPEQKYLHRD